MLLRPCLVAPLKTLTNQRNIYIPVASALSALTSYGKPLNYHANQVLHYPKSSLYEIVSDIASYPQFVPLIHDAQILALAKPKSDPTKELPALASLTVGIEALGPWIDRLGIKDSTVRFVSNVYCLPDKGIVEAVAGEQKFSKKLSKEELLEYGYGEQPMRQGDAIKDAGPEWLKVCRTRWQLTELEAGVKTEVDLRIEIDWKNSILAGATQAVLPTMAEHVIKAFEKRARDTLHA